MKDYFEKLTKDAAEKLLAWGGKLFFATCGKNEGIVTPFNFIYHERISKATDLTGVRFSVYFKAQDALHQKTHTWLLSCGCPSAILQKASDEDADWCQL